MQLTALSDEALLVSLHAVCADGRRLLVSLLAHLNEVEARRLELKSACPSLYEFCVQRLAMSDGEACRRIAAARLVKRYPSLMGRIESGALNLTTLYLLREQFKESNVEALAEEASGKTKREVEMLVARLAPKPDVPPAITELPAPARVLPMMESPLAPPEPQRIAPLSASRFEVRFTASAALREKIERAKDLLRHRHPNGDLEAIMTRAFDALVGQLEKERLAKSSRPQQRRTPARTRIPRAVRREVFERDGEQCTFVDAQGNRCPARGHLELDHVRAKARGGEATSENLRVLCRAHNRLHAEEDFGQARVTAKIHQRQRGYGDAMQTAERALHHLGFDRREVTRALSELASPTPRPVETLVREAIALLT